MINDLENHHKQTSKVFEDNGYLVLSEVLSKDQCRELTQYMFDLDKQDKLTYDQQCPLSGAIYGDPVFDDLMVQLAEGCLLYTSPSPRDRQKSRMPSSA